MSYGISKPRIRPLPKSGDADSFMVTMAVNGAVLTKLVQLSNVARLSGLGAWAVISKAVSEMRQAT